MEQRKEASWRRPEASRLWRIYDRLSLSVADRRQVFLRLITPLLANITDPLPPATLDKTPRELLVEHANNWVVEQMGDTGLDRIDNKLLRNILSNCIRLRPEVADHHYRLGALLCLMNNESGAFAALSQDQALDDLSDWSDRQWIAHMAEAFLSLTFDRGDSEKAKAITYLARGLLLGGDEARESLSR